MASRTRQLKFALVDDAGAPRDVFRVGESVFAVGHGLRPHASCEFSLANGNGETLLARYVADRHGALAAALLVAYAGVEGTSDVATGREVGVTARTKEGHEQVLRLVVEQDRATPRLFSSDRAGRLQTGIEQRTGEVGVTLHYFPAGCVRVYLVQRQFGWRVGDQVEPVRAHDGEPVVATVDVSGEESGPCAAGGKPDGSAGQLSVHRASVPSRLV